MSAPPPLLRVAGLSAAYGRIIALEGIDIAVRPGEAVAILGANGAGKSTLLRTIMGLLTPRAGEIELDGESLLSLPAERRVRRGLAYAPEGRRVFPGMTARENLEVACLGGAVERRRRMAAVFEIFPRLAERMDALGWQLSGGQQQMLAIGRALMPAPRLLLLDEPSLGLSPLLVGEVLNHVRDIVATGTAVLLAEQNVGKALEVCDRGYVLQVGRLVHAGRADELAASDHVRRAFLAG